MNGKHKSDVWTVEDSSEEAEVKLVEKFFQFCTRESEKMKTDSRIEVALEDLKFRMKKGIPGFNKSDIFNLITHLRTHVSLPVYGYNSSRYDLPIIFPHLVKIVDDKNLPANTISMLKKGLKYFSIHLGKLHFKDLLNFTCPVPLDKYLKTWTRDCAKLVYPYEKFGSIEEIRECHVFPPMTDFMTVLKPNIDQEVYLKCKEEFERRMNLPNNHSEKWSSFEDYLKFYNLSDVKPASEALINQFETYLENFGSYPNHHLGLPSFAREAMFTMYDETCPNIFTFPNGSDATEVFRKSIVGGLTNVYKRHVTLDETEDAAERAKYSLRGRKWKKIEFYDINSMYPTTFQEKFPCGLGFEWTCGPGDKMTKKLMTGRKISVESLEWLDFVSKVKYNLNLFQKNCVYFQGNHHDNDFHGINIKLS